MSGFDIGFPDAFIVTKTFTTLGTTFFTIGAKLLPSFTSRANGLLSTCTCNGAFCVSLPSEAVLKARPVPKVNAAPPSKSTLSLSGLSDFLVMNSFVRFTQHCEPTDLTEALLEHYKAERKNCGEALTVDASHGVLGNNNRLGQGDLVTVGSGPSAVHNDKIALGIKHEQTVVPSAFCVVHEKACIPGSICDNNPLRCSDGRHPQKRLLVRPPASFQTLAA